MWLSYHKTYISAKRMPSKWKNKVGFMPVYRLTYRIWIVISWIAAWWNLIILVNWLGFFGCWSMISPDSVSWFAYMVASAVLSLLLNMCLFSLTFVYFCFYFIYLCFYFVSIHPCVSRKIILLKMIGTATFPWFISAVTSMWFWNKSANEPV